MAVLQHRAYSLGVANLLPTLKLHLEPRNICDFDLIEIDVHCTTPVHSSPHCAHAHNIAFYGEILADVCTCKCCRTVMKASSDLVDVGSPLTDAALGEKRKSCLPHEWIFCVKESSDLSM